MKPMKIEVFNGQRNYFVYVNPEMVISIEPAYDNKNVQVVGQCLLSVGMGSIQVNASLETTVHLWEDTLARSKPVLSL